MIRSGIVSSINAATDADIAVGKSAVFPAQIPPAIPSTTSSIIKVQLGPLSGCGACSASGGCGVKLLPFPQAPLIIDCELPAGAVVSVGDQVKVQVAEPDSGWLTIVVRAYGMPTIGMISGALVGYWSALTLHMPQFTESFSLAGFVVGLAGGLIAWSRVESRVQSRVAKRAENSAQKRLDGEKRLQLHKVIQER